jgi:predicted transcriptional regulator
MENYEWRVRVRVKYLKHHRDKLNGKILERNLDIILNHDPSKKDLFLKEIDEMWKESDDLDSHINALKKIEIEFPPIPKSKSKSKTKAKAKAKAKPKPIVNVISVPPDEGYEIDN